MGGYLERLSIRWDLADRDMAREKWMAIHRRGSRVMMLYPVDMLFGYELQLVTRR